MPDSIRSLFQDLTGADPESLDLDTDIHTQTEDEREVLSEAIEKRDALQEDIQRLQDLLAKKEEALEDAVLMEDLGADPSSIKALRRNVKSIKETLEGKKGALGSAEKRVRQARQALRETEEKARQALRKEVNALAEENLERLENALNEAQRANMEFVLLARLNGAGELGASVPPYSLWLLPQRLGGDFSALQHIDSDLKDRGVDHDIRHGGGLSDRRILEFRRGVSEWAKQAAPIEVDQNETEQDETAVAA